METKGEGNYASTVYSNTGHREKDQGLTLSPKIPSTDQCPHIIGPSLPGQKSKTVFEPDKLSPKRNGYESRSGLLKNDPINNIEDLIEPFSKKRKLSDKSTNSDHATENYQNSPEVVSLSTANSKLFLDASDSQSLCDTKFEAWISPNEDQIEKAVSVLLNTTTNSHPKCVNQSSHSPVFDQKNTVHLMSRETLPKPQHISTVLQAKQTLNSSSKPDAILWNPDIPIPSTEITPQPQTEATRLSPATDQKVPDWLLDQSEAEYTGEKEDDLFKAHLFQQNNLTLNSSIFQSSEQTCISRHPSISIDPCDTSSQSDFSGIYPNQLYRKITSSLPMASVIEMAGSSKNSLLMLIAELTTYEDYQETAPNYKIPGPIRQILDELNAQWSQGTKKNEFRKALIAYVKEKIESRIFDLQQNENDQIHSQYPEILAPDKARETVEKLIQEIGFATEPSKILIRNILANCREQIAHLQHENSRLKTMNAKLLSDLEKSLAYHKANSCNLSALSAYLTQFPSSPNNPSVTGVDMEQNIILPPSIENWDGFEGDFWDIRGGDIFQEEKIISL
ncbi:hypothetical protein K3495_g3281 [Podosphaera aphanis]|nr:hypothetical protein K3495_g3281 [Podosphaera aphanis]